MVVIILNTLTAIVTAILGTIPTRLVWACREADIFVYKLSKHHPIFNILKSPVNWWTSKKKNWLLLERANMNRK